MNIVGSNALAKFPDIDVGQWNTTFDINVTGTLRGIQTCAPLMRDSGGGSIINIGSVAGITGNSPPTDASDATLPMPEIVATALVIRRDEQDKSRVEAGEAWQASAGDPDLVFTGRYGTAIDPRTLNRRFTARCDAGVRRLTVHDARRTCATLLVDLEVHPRVIMRILRHADQAVTMEIYAKASSKATQEALRRLGSRFDERSTAVLCCCTGRACQLVVTGRSL